MLIFVLWRILVAILAGFGLMILPAFASDAWANSLAHGAFVFLWPICSFLALIPLVLIPFDSLRRRTSQRSQRPST